MKCENTNKRLAVGTVICMLLVTNVLYGFEHRKAFISEEDTVESHSDISMSFANPEFKICSGLDRGVIATIFSAGVGFELDSLVDNNQLLIQFSYQVSALYRTPEDWTPSLTGHTGIVFKPFRTPSKMRVELIASLCSGTIQSQPSQLFQVNGGFEIRYELDRKLRLQALAVLCAGYDFQHKYGRESLIVGIAIDSWAQLTIDISSIWKGMSPIVNATRL